MSLLLDALKKAEQAKRGPATPLELAPDNSPTETQTRTPIAGVTPGPTLGAARRAAEQEAARTLFASKQHPVHSRPMWLLMGGVGLLAIAAGAFWLWYTMTYPPTPSPVLAQSPSLRPPAPIVTPQPVPQTPVAVEPEPPASAIGSTEKAKPVQPAFGQAPSAARSPNMVAAPAVPQLKRSNSPTAEVRPELAAAYSALTRADYPTAERQYRLVLADDPFNMDACLGMATVAAFTGNSGSAQAYYRRALEIDPKNPVAAAGLAALAGNSSASESQLRAQIAAQPNAAAPYNALGHVYASQSRWNEAQQSFFEAYRLEPANPDYAFNLAVSLDHLKQGKLAREYYNRALTLSATQPAAFNPADVTVRLSQLAP